MKILKKRLRVNTRICITRFSNVYEDYKIVLIISNQNVRTSKFSHTCVYTVQIKLEVSGGYLHAKVQLYC